MGDSNWQQKEKGADLLTMLSSTSLVALTCLTTATAAPAGNSAAAPTKNIAELAIATPDLSTLLAAVKAAGLVETLAGEGPFTVFAPTNKAFAKIPKATLDGLLADKEALTAVLLRHVAWRRPDGRRRA